MKQYECSVIIVQYNPIWQKLKRTLNSVINQKECIYEIVIADDGSNCNLFDEIQRYFAECSFEDYKLVDNKNNQGTVKNVISGLKAGTGKYARVIAPGDMLYSDTTLKKIVEFMNQHNAKEVFGKMAFYSKEDEEIKFFFKPIPQNLKPYEQKNTKKIKKYLVGLGDNISGASYTWDKAYYLEKLTRIEDKVIYMEDCVNAFTIYEGNEIYFMDEYVTWYEYGTGISTSASEKWTLLLGKDWIAFLKELGRLYPNDIKIARARFYHQLGQNRSLFGKIIKNVVFLDWYLYNRFATRIFMKQSSRIEKDYIVKYHE